jgi:hypothetical protein
LWLFVRGPSRYRESDAKGDKTVNLTPLTSFLTLMVAISMAVERVVEIVKGIFPPLSKTWPGDKDYLRFAILQVLAAVAGAGVAFAAQSQIESQVQMLDFKAHPYIGFTVIGLMSSGGSAMWNHALDIVQAMKVKQQVSNPVGTAAAGPAANPVVKPAGV